LIGTHTVVVASIIRVTLSTPATLNMADLEMKPVDTKGESDSKAADEEKKDEETIPTPPSPAAEIKLNISFLQRAVTTLEPRFTHRVLRTLTALRKRLNDSVLREAIIEVYPKGASIIVWHSSGRLAGRVYPLDSAVKTTLLSWLPDAPEADQSMDVDSVPAKNSKAPSADPVPEAEIYIRLLIIHHLLTSPTTFPKAMDLVHQTIEKMQSLNRRSMDPIAAKIWFAVERTYELNGQLADARP
jgi:26S proteasome regulatory subunit N3